MERIDILIVEDNSEDLELMLSALGRAEYAGHIEVARDGEEALDFLLARGAHIDTFSAPPRLVLLDLQLPKLNGIEVLKQVKVHPKTRSIPVVMFTSSKEACDVSECYNCGANSYIQKPYGFEEYRKTIRTLSSYWMDTNESPPPLP